MSEPIVPSAGEHLAADGLTFSMREWAHAEMRPPPLHVHHHDDEAWHVLEGTLQFRFADGRTAEVQAGGTAFVPAGAPHTYGCTGPARYLLVTTPKIFALIDALHGEDVEASDRAADIYRAHDSELLE